MRIAPFVAAVLLAPFAFAGEGVREVDAALKHAANDYLPHAHGGVGLREGSDFHRFSVRVEGAGDAALTVQLGKGDAHMVDVGTMSWSDHGLVLVLTTLEGGHLPLAAAHAGDLSGRTVRVVDHEGHAILLGVVPKFEEHHEPDPKPEPKPEPKPAGDLWAKSAMVRPEHSPYDDSRGVIFVGRRAESEVLGFEVGHLAPLTHYEVFLGDHDGGDQIGDVTTDGEGGASLVRDTAKGGELPGGASLADLAGRHLEVRHHGDVVLLGAIPHLSHHDDVKRVHEDAKHQDEESGAKLHVVVDIQPKKGHEACKFDVKRLPHGKHAEKEGLDVYQDAPKAARRKAKAELYMDDGTGTMSWVGSAKIDRQGRARLLFTTRHGRTLPLSAATLRELAGRAIEVRINGTTYVGGSMPNL